MKTATCARCHQRVIPRLDSDGRLVGHDGHLEPHLDRDCGTWGTALGTPLDPLRLVTIRDPETGEALGAAVPPPGSWEVIAHLDPRLGGPYPVSAHRTEEAARRAADRLNRTGAHGNSHHEARRLS